MPAFESLPVELVADILGELDVASLVIVSYLSSRLRAIASDPSLNPWRRPILRTICNSDGDGDYEPQLRHLSVRHTVPRQNWVDILTLAKAEYVLFEMTLPNLKETEWEECFRRRFLSGWAKWKTSTWKAAFLKCVWSLRVRCVTRLLNVRRLSSLSSFNCRILHRVWHRSHSACTADESWTK